MSIPQSSANPSKKPISWLSGFGAGVLLFVLVLYLPIPQSLEDSSAEHLFFRLPRNVKQQIYQKLNLEPGASPNAQQILSLMQSDLFAIERRNGTLISVPSYQQLSISNEK